MVQDALLSWPGERAGPRRFLLACWPFAGHISPFMSVALALRDRGHDVAFYTGESLRTTVEAQGFRLFPFEHVSEERAEACMRSMDTVAPSGRPATRLVLRTFRDWMVETMPGQNADLEPVLDAWQPDVIVTETAMWGPILVLWQARRIPVVILSTLLGCLVPGPDAPPAGLGLGSPRTWQARLLARTINRVTELAGRGLRRRIDEFRAADGLAPMRCTVNAFTGRLPLYLIGSLPELDYNRGDLPPSVQYVGPCTWHLDEPADNDWLDRVPGGRPWIHVTESTLSYNDPFVLRAAAQGLGGRPFEVILTTGRQRDPATISLGTLAPNIHLARWVSHERVLPRCAVLVTTGGAGTIMAALQAGVPLVVVPTTWDKPDNARRVVEAGVGVRLAPRDCTPGGLQAAVERVLTDSEYGTNARRLAERLRSAPGPGRAVELLEEVVTRRVLVA